MAKSRKKIGSKKINSKISTNAKSKGKSVKGKGLSDLKAKKSAAKSAKSSKSSKSGNRVSRAVRQVIRGAKSQGKKITEKTKQTSLKALRRASVRDELLLKLGPSVQAQLKKMSDKMESGNWGMDDVKRLGLQILAKAQEVTNSLKTKTPQAKKTPQSKSKKVRSRK